MPEEAGIALGPSLADIPDGELPQKELARFFWYSHDVLVVMDSPGRILAISPSVERVLGHTVEELIGQRLVHLVHPDDRSEVKAQARTLLEGRAVGDLDARISSADGGWVPMRWSVSGRPEGRAYAVGRDQTDRALRRDAVLRNEMAELRLRTAMELHDGILQTLTGASLQIAVARRLLETDLPAARAVLESLAQSVAAEQQEMRLYVDELKGRPPVWTDATRRLPERIEAALERLSSIWGVTTSVDIRVRSRITGELGRQILRIIQEATVNAARHAGAESVSVSVAREGTDVTIVISDDGDGFSFLGEYDYEALKEKRLGPLSLKHRVEETGGTISINSTPHGSTIRVRVPVPKREAWR